MTEVSVRVAIVGALVLLPAVALADGSAPVCQIAMAPFDIHCLPAISADGQVVAVFEGGGDLRGLVPDLTIALRPVAGGRAERIAILTAADKDRAGGAMKPWLKEEVDERLKEANARLRRGGFVGLTNLRVRDVEVHTVSPERVSVGDGFEIDLRGDQLDARTPEGRLRARVPMPRVPARCRKVNRPRLDAAWANATILVVLVGQDESERCPQKRVWMILKR